MFCGVCFWGMPHGMSGIFVVVCIRFSNGRIFSVKSTYHSDNTTQNVIDGREWHLPEKVSRAVLENMWPQTNLWQPCSSPKLHCQVAQISATAEPVSGRNAGRRLGRAAPLLGTNGPSLFPIPRLKLLPNPKINTQGSIFPQGRERRASLPFCSLQCLEVSKARWGCKRNLDFPKLQ